MNKYINLIEKLSNTNGIAGYESEIRNIFKEEASKLDLPIVTDRIGGIAISRKANQPNTNYTIMLASHMDEIGFITTKIDDDGFVFFQTIGGWWMHVLLGQKLVLTTQSGTTFTGVVGSVPPHLLDMEARTKVLKLDQLFIDFGFESRDDAFKKGVSIGDMITPDSMFRQLDGNENRFVGKAFDDRLGCAINLAVMHELQGADLSVNVVFGGTVQEEVGTRGAKTLGQTISPDLAIILDCGMTGDFPGSPKSGEVLDRLGEGASISLMDRTFIGHPKLRQHIQATATENKLKYQLVTMTGGGSDGGPIHLTNEGVPSVYMGTPVRYIHSHNGIIDIRDFEQIVKILTQTIKSLNNEVIDEIFGV